MEMPGVNAEMPAGPPPGLEFVDRHANFAEHMYGLRFWLSHVIEDHVEPATWLMILDEDIDINFEARVRSCSDYNGAFLIFAVSFPNSFPQLEISSCCSDCRGFLLIFAASFPNSFPQLELSSCWSLYNQKAYVSLMNSGCA
jgi:hypothetical protein